MKTPQMDVKMDAYHKKPPISWIRIWGFFVLSGGWFVKGRIRPL